MMDTKTICFLFGFLGCLAVLLTVQAQDQSGFISLDCGLPENSRYTETTTKINYISDAAYIESGESKSANLTFKSIYERQLWSLRSFPQGIRNCYNISNIISDTKYLIRASFLYGNYDGLKFLPTFDLYIGDSLWETVEITFEASETHYEIIHIPAANRVQICLINTETGKPFISALEFRPLPNYTYPIEQGSLSVYTRLDMGSTSNVSYRFPYDVFDRIWYPYNDDDFFRRVSTSLTVDADSHTKHHPAAIVMETAIMPQNASDSLDLWWEPEDENTQFFIYLHFAELVKLQSKQFRGFNISHNGKYWGGPIIPDYLYTSSIYSIRPLNFPEKQHNFSFFRTENSTLPPVINALEIYFKVEISELESDQGDVDSIRKIKSTYGIIKDWQGDPCIPRAYPWSGVGCSNESTPRIKSLNLSSSSLKGEITPHITSLAMLQKLDLSNNFLTGKVPDFLSNLSHLQILNLENNNLTGSLPPELIQRKKDGSLSLSIQGNPNLDQCMSDQCTKETLENKSSNNNLIIPVVASVGGLLAILTIAGIIYWITNSKKEQGQDAASAVDSVETHTHIGSSMEMRSRQFTYAEVLRMTNNFERILGKGGFGIVYYGIAGDIQVAVKMISPSAIQRYNQFQAEVTILMRVHHKNLTSLVGYLNDGGHLGLIYEYMANGNLAQHLSGRSSSILSWEERLRIAIDGAQGLEYLHHGCKPPIVHRDVKTTNILLTKKFQAKLSDFGLSKSYPTDDKSYMTTVVVGTPGYLDPEYYTSNRLTEKSDVYGFGVSLMEIISCRPVILKTEDKNTTYIAKWVRSMVEQGDIKNIVDPRLQGVYETNSVWKAVEVALGCVSVNPGERPTMSQVVADLKDCLGMELRQRSESRPLDSKDSIEMMSFSMVMNADHINPMAR